MLTNSYKTLLKTFDHCDNVCRRVAMAKNLLCYLAAILITVLLHSCSRPSDTSFSAIEQGFQSVPDSIQTSVYWYWISDNLSKEGVIRDLQAMKAVGINRAFIGNIGLGPTETPYGNVKLFSDEWWDIMHTALKTAGDLGIEIGIFNSPGWSQSGGPWVKPEESMRYFISLETVVEGGKPIEVKLKKPIDQFQDERVIAFRTPKDYGSNVGQLSPKLSAMPHVEQLGVLLDGDTTKTVRFSEKGKQEIYIDLSSGFAAQSLTLYPAAMRMTARAKLEVKNDTGYQTIKAFDINRSNDALNVGFYPHAPVAVSFPSVEGSSFRLTFDNYTSNSGITELILSSSPKVESYIEKTLAKMFHSPLPYWNEYQWPMQQEISDRSYAIDPKEIVDVTSFMTADGTLKWNAPTGTWTLMRTGMTPTLVTNAPASPEGTGLEVDKMSKKHVASHFDGFLGEIIRRIPKEDRKTWKVVVEDSYETGGQNWTDGFIEDFKKAYHYDPLPYLPVFRGDVVGNQEQSDRFLWDVRRLVADKVAYDYVGGLRDVSHKNGLTTWLENYGHWGFPGEFLQYGGQSDEIGGEFWSEGDLGNIENRAASSAAHIYGKTKVSAESFTAAGNDFGRYPAVMKQRGDRFFTEGINNTLLHVYIHQPYEDKKPGVNAWFGAEFNRFNTWFYDMDLFLQYLKRCNFMLQQGKYVADVAYFIGEDVPKMTGIQEPALPQGYAFDYINGEVIRDRLTVKDGRFVLPDGMSYKVLVLPKLETMRPQLLEKIAALVAQGGVVLGPRPLRSPSLQDYPAADRQVQELAAKLWGKIDGKNIKVNAYGKGKVMDGMRLEEVFELLKMQPDFGLPQGEEALYIHRKVGNGDIYFVSNQKNERIDISPKFKVRDLQPELWDATTGKIRILPQFVQDEGSTKIPLSLEPFESAFIVFRNKVATQLPEGTGSNYGHLIEEKEIASSWTVVFDSLARGPVEPVVFGQLGDWSLHDNPKIKYYSGHARYHNSFQIDKINPGERVTLDLGNVVAIAKVKINGQEAGGVWTYPYRVDITDFIKEGKNEVEVRVVNTWINRLIGDSFLPENERGTWLLTASPYHKDSKPVPAGLLGPVVLKRTKYEAMD